MANSSSADRPEGPRVVHKDEAAKTHPADVNPDQVKDSLCDPLAADVNPKVKDEDVDGNAEAAPGVKTLDELIALMKETRDLVDKEGGGLNSAWNMLHDRKDLNEYQIVKLLLYARHEKDEDYTLAERMHLMYHMSEGFPKLNVPWCCCRRGHGPSE